MGRISIETGRRIRISPVLGAPVGRFVAAGSFAVV